MRPTALLALIGHSRHSNVRGCRPTSFSFRLDGPAKLEILTPEERKAWTAIRGFRNFTAHSEQPFLIAPGAAVSIFLVLAASIDRFFA
jgi:hypothetical protein